MFIAVFVGVLSGIVGVLCWLVIQLILNMPGYQGLLGGTWVFFPLIIGAVAAVAHALADAAAARTSGRTGGRQALSDFFESFHFGVFILHPLVWIARGLVSLLNAFFGGTFGLEGGVLELGYATLPPVSRYLKLFLEQKQLFVICTMSASLSVALGAPFSGALMAIELVNVLNAKVRRGAVVASLVAYGTAMLAESAVLSAFYVDSAVERLNVLASLFAGLRPLNIEAFQWLVLGVAALCLGSACGLLTLVVSQGLTRGSAAVNAAFGRRFEVAMLGCGALMALVVWGVPDSFNEPWRLWEELAWSRLSTPGAVVLLIAEVVLLILAFSAWGSSGLMSPMLMIGALLGYAIGNSIGSNWAVPLAIVGAASALAGAFRIPLAASALVLELGHDGPMWWLATLGVIGAVAISRSLNSKPLHELLLARHGLRVLGGRAASLLENLKAREAMFADFETVHDSASFQDVRTAALEAQHNFIGVLNADGTFAGLLSIEQLPSRVRRALRPDANPLELAMVERIIELSDLVDRHCPILRPDDSLERALELLQNRLCIPVVDEQRKLRGLLFESAIVGLYKREIARTVIQQG